MPLDPSFSYFFLRKKTEDSFAGRAGLIQSVLPELRTDANYNIIIGFSD
jgi:hypothetical protein